MQFAETTFLEKVMGKNDIKVKKKKLEGDLTFKLRFTRYATLVSTFMKRFPLRELRETCTLLLHVWNSPSWTKNRLYIGWDNMFTPFHSTDLFLGNIRIPKVFWCFRGLLKKRPVAWNGLFKWIFELNTFLIVFLNIEVTEIV